MVLIRGISMLFIYSLLFNYTNTNAAPGHFNPNTDILIDDFQNTKADNKLFSGGRYWYSYGGLKIEVDNHILYVKGKNLSGSVGFGIDPTSKGINGPIINAKEKSLLCIEFNDNQSTTPMLELYDEKYSKTDRVATIDERNNKRWITFNIPENLRKNNLSKIQFKSSNDIINVAITKIYFSNP